MGPENSRVIKLTARYGSSFALLNGALGLRCRFGIPYPTTPSRSRANVDEEITYGQWP